MRKSKILAIGIGVLVASCSSQNDALNRAADFLVEPKQAEYSNIRRSGNTICGLVKGKTRIDSYEGFRPFWSDPEAGIAEILNFDSADQFVMMANRVCPSQFGDLLQAKFSDATVQTIRDEISKNAPNN